MSTDDPTPNPGESSTAPVYKRIVLKLSGESFQGSQGFGIDAETVHAIAREVKEVSDLGIQMAIRKHYRKRKLPKPAQMEKIAKCWEPYRSVAAWYLWRSLDIKTLEGSQK